MFQDCISLREVIIPESVTTIESQAFSGCTSLASITIPESVTSIGEEAFRECTSLSSIIIPEGVTYIGGSAGAHIATRDISHVKEFDEVPENMTDYKGLGLFDGILICHYTPERQQVLKRTQKSSEFRVYTLTDDESIVIK